MQYYYMSRRRMRNTGHQHCCPWTAPFTLSKKISWLSRRSEALTIVAFAQVTSEHDFIIQTFEELEYIDQLTVVKYFIDTNDIQNKGKVKALKNKSRFSIKNFFFFFTNGDLEDMVFSKWRQSEFMPLHEVFDQVEFISNFPLLP